MLPKGSFNNYMDQILSNFDHLLPLIRPEWTIVDIFHYYLVMYMTKLGLSNDHLPTFSCPRSYWMTPNQTYQWSRVGCSFSADTYIFRHGAGSAKNGCSIVEERLLSAIKEDGVEAKKKTRTSPPLLQGKTKVKCGVTLSLDRHPPQPAWLLFWYSQWV